MTWENPSKGAPHNIRQKILNRDNHQCVKCGATQHLEVDHIKNIATGGTHHPTNLQTLCKTCHNQKTRQEAQTGRNNRKTRAQYPQQPHPGLKTP